MMGVWARLMRRYSRQWYSWCACVKSCLLDKKKHAFLWTQKNHLFDAKNITLTVKSILGMQMCHNNCLYFFFSISVVWCTYHLQLIVGYTCTCKMADRKSPITISNKKARLSQYLWALLRWTGETSLSMKAYSLSQLKRHFCKPLKQD